MAATNKHSNWNIIGPDAILDDNGKRQVVLTFCVSFKGKFRFGLSAFVSSVTGVSVGWSPPIHRPDSNSGKQHSWVTNWAGRS